MAHPYKSAGHKNDPKWLGGLERATGGGVRSRARGGETSDPIPGGWQHEGQNVGESLDQEADWKKQDLDNAMSARKFEPGVSNAGQGPTPNNLINLQYRRKMGFPEDRKRGGRVKKRADGGEVDDDNGAAAEQREGAAQGALNSESGQQAASNRVQANAWNNALNQAKAANAGTAPSGSDSGLGRKRGGRAKK